MKLKVKSLGFLKLYSVAYRNNKDKNSYLLIRKKDKKVYFIYIGYNSYLVTEIDLLDDFESDYEIVIPDVKSFVNFLDTLNSNDIIQISKNSKIEILGKMSYDLIVSDRKFPEFDYVIHNVLNNNSKTKIELELNKNLSILAKFIPNDNIDNNYIVISNVSYYVTDKYVLLIYNCLNSVDSNFYLSSKSLDLLLASMFDVNKNITLNITDKYYYYYLESTLCVFDIVKPNMPDIYKNNYLLDRLYINDYIDVCYNDLYYSLKRISYLYNNNTVGIQRVIFEVIDSVCLRVYDPNYKNTYENISVIRSNNITNNIRVCLDIERVLFFLDNMTGKNDVRLYMSNNPVMRILVRFEEVLENNRLLFVIATIKE